MSRRRPPPECAICGTALPPDARACPNCGADERTGWDADDDTGAGIYDGLDLPGEEDTAEAYERFLRNEMPRRARHHRGRFLIIAVGVVLIIALALAMLSGRF
ncbi:MAG: zinc ribbon domain-containing protein [Opitutaceae bacterium]|jgi:predicted nucleic acid-binding Zn ribbon protein|nr:zinc ribbon domain-containing protein [Opitutaceae bacterium]